MQVRKLMRRIAAALMILAALSGCSALSSFTGPDWESSRIAQEAGEASQAGDAVRALELMRQAIAVAETELPEEHPEFAAQQLRLASYMAANGLDDEAEPIYREILERATRSDLEQHSATLIARQNLGRLLGRSGRFNAAEETLRQAVQDFRAELGDDDILTANAVTYLSDVLLMQGRVAEAEAVLDEALERRSDPNASAPANFMMLLRLAGIRTEQGRHSDAEELQRDVMARSRSALGETHWIASAAANNLAQTLSATGRDQEAVALLEAVIRADGYDFTALDDDNLGNASLLKTMSNLGILLWRTGDQVRSAQLLRDAYIGRSLLLGENHPETLTGKALFGAAAAMLIIDDIDYRELSADEAIRHLREAYDAKRETLGPNHLSSLSTANDLANILLFLRRDGDAEAIYEDLVPRLTSIHGWAHQETISSVVYLSMAKLLLGKEADALDLLREASPGAIDWVSGQFASARSAEQQTWLSGDPTGFQDATLTAVFGSAEAERADIAAEIILAWKHVDGASEASIASFIADSDDPAVVAAATDLAARRRDLAAALAQNATGVDAEKAALAAARSRLVALSTDFAAEERERRADLAAVRAALQPDEALVEFRVYDNFIGGGQNVAGVIITRDLPPEVFLLGEVEDIEVDVSFATDFGQPDRATAALEAIAAKLRPHLQSSLAGKARVFLAPDGPLNLLPFDAVPLFSEPWIETQDLRMLSTGRALARERDRSTMTGIVALGDAAFDDQGGEAPATRRNAPELFMAEARAATRDSELAYFQHLAQTGPEARTVAQMWEAATGGDATVLLSGAAREGAIKAMATPRVLHLATHGFFLPDEERAAANPMALSGLALTGANQGIRGGGDADGEDGILWALEAMSLPLRGTELVLLSACDTAMGVENAAGGVYGLGRAFQIAGADNVVLTLWQLYDASAAEFTAEFYQRWLSSGLDDPSAALRDTKLAWLRSGDPERASPEFWAPYRLVQTGR